MKFQMCLRSSGHLDRIHHITHKFLHITNSKEDIIQRDFPDIAQQLYNHNWLGERPILAAKNKDVEDLNATIENFLPGQLVSFKSVYTIMNQNDVVNYPTQFLNSVELPGLPPHNLHLTVGSVVIMRRNINEPRLCNGTRLAVRKMMNNIIEATILKGKYKGEDVLILRIPMIPSDLPVDLKRLQFPVRLAFAMTINKFPVSCMDTYTSLVRAWANLYQKALN
ncbi:hypothetical protein GWI33_016728 [Rhynchophorus ferrugineus]|uniref:DNA helicase Pif1-like 2B domain-containing protein n=1 Tax=Rhynchophorus ferrugineus TaxID=354439 RepID=A0A834M8D2_RHYFE|nr:hypothetical protein GWI33_016728 [Rhynchophorus ferrugineus]